MGCESERGRKRRSHTNRTGGCTRASPHVTLHRGTLRKGREGGVRTKYLVQKKAKASALGVLLLTQLVVVFYLMVSGITEDAKSSAINIQRVQTCVCI